MLPQSPCPSGPYLTRATAISAGSEYGFAIAECAPTAPQWYSDGKIVCEPESVKAEGKLTLHTLSGGMTVECKVKDSETIENPSGGDAGVDQMTAFALSGCQKTKQWCASGETLEVHANPPWSTELLAGPPIRDEIADVELKIVCTKAAIEKVVDVLTGTLTPEVGNSVLKFGAGSGELAESVAPNKATVTGTDKLKGPAGDRKIAAKTP